MAAAIASCPAREEICGTKKQVLNDSSSNSITLEVNGFDNKLDSCHWVVSSKCDVPEIHLEDDYSGTGD